MQWFGPGWDDTGCKRQDSKNEPSTDCGVSSVRSIHFSLFQALRP
jgi:hypothetical protein